MSKAWSVCGIILSIACLLWILRAPRQEVSRGGTVVDTSSLVAARDSSLADARRARASFDSLQAWIDTAPADTVWKIARRLIRDTVDTGHVDTFEIVRALVLDDSACRVGRDSLRGALQVAWLRLAAERDLVALLQQTVRPAPQAAPDRPWTLAAGVEIDGDRIRPGVAAEARSGWASYGVGLHATRSLERPSISVHFGFNFGGF